MIGLLIFLIAGLITPLLFYYCAYSIPNRKWLKIWLISCLTAAILVISSPRQASLILKINSSDGFVKVRYLFILLLIFTSCIGAIAGTISKMILFNIKQNKDDSIKEWQIHAASICLIIFTFPFAWILVFSFE